MAKRLVSIAQVVWIGLLGVALIFFFHGFFVSR
jgi:hypothetical protein